MLGELAHFQLQEGELGDLCPQIIHHTVDTGKPFVEHLDCFLQRLDPGGGRIGVGRDLALQLVEALVLGSEVLVDLIEDEFGLGIHGATATLQASEVVVISKGGRI